MSQRSSGIMWLVIAGISAVLSLGCCGGVGYGVYHVETTIPEIDRQLDEDEKLLKDPKKGAKEDEVRKRLDESDKRQHAYSQYRWFAIAGGIFGLIPPVVMLGALFMAYSQFRKKPEDDEDDEDEPDEKPKDKGGPGKSSSVRKAPREK